MDLKKTYNGKTVLVTGHTGFKGSWLSLWLKSLGADVYGYGLAPITDPSLYYSMKTYNFMTDIKGDITHKNRISSVIKSCNPDFIFHLAAQPIVRVSYENPVETFNTNVDGTINVLESIRDSDHPITGIFITSDKCYHNNEWNYAYRENDALGGKDPYSASKAMAELAINSYSNSYFNTKESIHAVASARAGNIIGGGDWSKDRIVTDCITSINSNKQIMLRNPGAIRPWQFVLDALYGYLLLGSKLKSYPMKYSGSWNFGPRSENNLTVRDLSDKIISSWGKGIVVNSYEPDKKPEAHYLMLDSTKSITELGWSPRYNIDQTIEKTVAWYKQYYSGSVDMKAYSLNQINEWHETFNIPK